MADALTLPAETGRVLGTRPSKRLRASGHIPAVVYGAGDDPTPIAVEWSALRAALTTDAGMNALITLQFDGDERLTIVKDMQRHPVRRDVLHVDFLVIDRFTPLDVEVPIVLVDTDGSNLDGLVLDQQLFTLPVSALPMSIPNELVVSCAELTLDEPVRASDVTLPEGVELNVEPDEAIATASVPTVIEEPEPAEGEEGEDAEGEAAEGGDDAEASDDAGDDAGDGGDEG